MRLCIASSNRILWARTAASSVSGVGSGAPNTVEVARVGAGGGPCAGGVGAGGGPCIALLATTAAAVVGGAGADAAGAVAPG